MEDGGDEEPAGKRRRGDMWTRLLRADCTGVQAKDAERWLKEYAEVVRVSFLKVKAGLSRAVGVDAEDLMQVGRFAIIEACLTYDPTHKSGSTLRTWVGCVVHWRMSDFLDKTSRQDGEIVDHDWALETQEATQVDEFEERMEYTEQLRLLAVNFALMPHRTRIILVNRLEGAGSEEIAVSLGISPFREQQIVAHGRQALRVALANDLGMVTAPTPDMGTSKM